MRYSIKTALMKEILSIVINSIPQRSTVPIVQDVKIVASNKGIEFFGTDLDTGIHYFVEAAKDNVEIEEEGVLLLSAHKLYEIVNVIESDKFNMSSDGFSGSIQLHNSYFKVVGAEPSDYPDFPRFDDKSIIVITGRDIKKVIERVSFVIDPTAGHVLSGALLSIEDNTLIMSGSDGARLSVARAKCINERSKRISIIIPVKALNIIEKIIGEDKKVLLNIDENQFRLKTDNLMFFTRLIEGKYPNYEDVLSKEPDRKAKVSMKSLLLAIKKVSILAGSDKIRPIKMGFSEDKVKLYSSSLGLGEASVELDIEYKGKPFTTSFNATFFEDVLRVLDSSEVVLEFKGDSGPCMIREGKDFMHFIAPLSE